MQIFRMLLNKLPETPRVSTIVTDFEAAVWKAISSSLPNVTVRGCYFHYSQAVWRKIQFLGKHTSFVSVIFFRHIPDIHLSHYSAIIQNSIYSCVALLPSYNHYWAQHFVFCNVLFQVSNATMSAVRLRTGSCASLSLCHSCRPSISSRLSRYIVWNCEEQAETDISPCKLHATKNTWSYWNKLIIIKILFMLQHFGYTLWFTL